MLCPRWYALLVAVACTSSLAMSGMAGAQPTPSHATGPSAIVINNVRIFDGCRDQLKPGNMLIEDRKITRIAATPMVAPPGAQVIAVGTCMEVCCTRDKSDAGMDP